MSTSAVLVPEPLAVHFEGSMSYGGSQMMALGEGLIFYKQFLVYSSLVRIGLRQKIYNARLPVASHQ